MGNHKNGRVRTCDTTGLLVCKEAEFFIRIHAVVAVVFLLIGAIAALMLALTRWPTVHLLSAGGYYKWITVHGLNMLVFWIVSLEMSILYFCGTVLLHARLASKSAAWVTFVMMLVGAITTNWAVFTDRATVMMTSYVPLEAHPAFYLGLILFAVGALIGVFNFFATVHIAKRDKTFEGSVPIVVFGAITAAILAVFTLIMGAIALIPAFTWTLGFHGPPDPGFYRVAWWGFGHQSQQINVAAMVAVWYLLSNLTVGGKPLNEGVCRSAFGFYILFIGLASAHHALVDPGVTAGWKIWNTSYAMYLAVLASMIHGFTVPASIEVAQRKKGYKNGLFEWLIKAPWKNPGFSAMFISLVIFGFLGGITGVTLGTQQINIIAHNTLRITGHFHTTVVGGTTLAFMGLCYYVVPLMFQRDFFARGVARIQPYIFGGGITMMALGMNIAGSFGVPRRHWDVTFAGAPIPVEYASGAHLSLAFVGIGGTLAFIGLLTFILLVVAAVFFGPSLKGRPMPEW